MPWRLQIFTTCALVALALAANAEFASCRVILNCALRELVAMLGLAEFTNTISPVGSLTVACCA